MSTMRCEMCGRSVDTDLEEMEERRSVVDEEVMVMCQDCAEKNDAHNPYSLPRVAA